MKKILMLILLCSAAFSGCGGGGGGGSTAVFDTVTVTAVPAVIDLDSDVATHALAADDPLFCTSVPACSIAPDTCTVSSDSVNVALTSTVIPGLPASIRTSPVEITSVTITFTPDPTNPTGFPTPPTQFETMSVILNPGASATISVRAISQDIKGAPPFTTLICGTPLLKYIVKLKFEGVEVNSNAKESFEASLNVRVADFVDAAAAP